MEEQNNTPQPETQQTEQQQPPVQAAPEAEKKADPADVEKNKTMAILAYFIFFLPLLTDAKDSPFAKFHANQSLVILLASVAVQVLGFILAVVTFGIGGLLIPLAMIAVFVFWIMGLMNAANGKMKELPLIGGIHLLDK